MTQPQTPPAPPTIEELRTEAQRLRARERELHEELVGMPQAMERAGHEARRLYNEDHHAWQMTGTAGPPPSLDSFLAEHVGPLKAREATATAEYEAVKVARLEAVERLESARAADADARMRPLTAAMADLTAQRDAIDGEMGRVNAARSGIARERDEAGGRASQAAHDARLLRQIQEAQRGGR